MILKCTCSYVFQDEKYGSKMKVHNFAKNINNKSGGWRCAVCGKMNSSGNVFEKKKESKK